MSTLSTLLRALMLEVGITVTELARQTGVGQPVIHRMASGETDNPKVASLSPIAKFFNVNISQLIGDEPLPADRFAGSHNPFYRQWSRLPLLSWKQAIQWPEVMAQAEIQSYISTEAYVSEKAFAIRMEDTTMTAQFPLNTMMVIEPNIKPHNKDFIAIYVEGDEQIQFKQMLLDGSDLYLKPLNPDFETKKITKNYKILGVMIQAFIEYYTTRPIISEDIIV
jgi:SOS-response transcriptional repressor LexA